ncbi:MAG TPA: heterodisulfide reductase-related iron-sulfur binding cluster [Anaerolineales bacterium]|nr:heterodisulfide reductase-related iron-sulfur binding cluster [Anaerolineales bacterium]
MAITISADLATRIREATGENVYQCYQCVKCTSGCPLAEYFDLAPNQVMRAAQLGMEDLLFGSRTPWLCASCQTCTTRCPQGVDIARVMDFVVSEAMASGIKPMVPEVALFNKVFLRNVEILGRAYELGLIAEMNLRTRQPFKDLDLGLEMFRRGKVHLLPEVIRRKRRKAPIAPAARPADEVGYFPGCSLHSMAEEFNASTLAVLGALGVKPVEPDGWMCCGSTPAHRVDHRLATRLPLESLVLFEQAGLNEVTLPCAACFNRFRSAVRDLRRDPQLKQELDQEIGYEYQDRVAVLSLLDLIVDRIGLEAVTAQVKRPLEGLKVACYYGCLLTRPPAVTGSPEAEYPRAMDRVMQALGATPIDWDRKVACCGASLSLTRTDIVLKLSGEILANARARGAEAIVVACPLCHANLDGRQTQMEADSRMPALFFTQLMALAFGLPQAAALKRNVVDARPLLAGRGLL